MADRIFTSIVNQKTVTQIQLQVLALIAAQVNNVLEAQIGLTAQFDSDLLDIQPMRITRYQKFLVKGDVMLNARSTNKFWF